MTGPADECPLLYDVWNVQIAPCGGAMLDSLDDVAVGFSSPFSTAAARRAAGANAEGRAESRPENGEIPANYGAGLGERGQRNP